jgi:serine/arginine repetitive matrix protein 2
MLPFLRLRSARHTIGLAPEPEPEPLYQPLRPAKVRVASGTLKASYSSLSTEKRSALGDNNASSPLTFGSRSSSRAGSSGSMEEYSGGSLTPAYSRPGAEKVFLGSSGL